MTPPTRQIAAAAAVNSTDDAAVVQIYNGWNPHATQKRPVGDWNIWLILAGRGFGKTRTGAEWIDSLATHIEGIRIGLVGATHADARSVMVEGASGLLSVNSTIQYESSRRLLRWIGGSTAQIFSAEEPDGLRGPNFHFAWGDEVARWGDGEAVLRTLRMALRLGDRPRLLLTTTPRPLPWLKALSVAPGVVTTRGRMMENREHLAPAYVEAMTRDFGGTRHGRQELDGEFIEDHEGALWTRAGIEACRHSGPIPVLARVVVAVDPSVGASETTDACGIVVAGLTEAGTALVLADRTIQGVLPADWARVVVAAYHEFNADLVVAEINNGGKLIEGVLQSEDRTMKVKSIHARQGKVARAEPVANQYAHARVFHAAPFPELEDEMCAMGVAGRFAGAGRSPDRVDALVYALTELLIGARHAEPGIRSL